MRFVTPVALALTLAMAGGAVSAPAFAKKEDKKGSAPKLNVSPDVLKALQTAQAAAGKQDWAGAKAALADADSKAKSNDDKYQIGAIKLNTSIGSKDAGPGGARRSDVAIVRHIIGFVGPVLLCPVFRCG